MSLRSCSCSLSLVVFSAKIDFTWLWLALSMLLIQLFLSLLRWLSLRLPFSESFDSVVLRLWPSSILNALIMALGSIKQTWASALQILSWSFGGLQFVYPEILPNSMLFEVMSSFCSMLTDSTQISFLISSRRPRSKGRLTCFSSLSCSEELSVTHDHMILLKRLKVLRPRMLY